MDELGKIVLKYALQNAIFYEGKARVGAVIGKVLAERPELKEKAKEIGDMAGRTVIEINGMTLEQQRKMLIEIAPDLMIRERKERELGLPQLREVSDKVVMRFAPNPSGPLHIGHSRVAILNDEYVKRYGGKYLVRFEDTDPDRVDPEAYDVITEDIEWLGIDVTETYYQSDRFETYYGIARRLLEEGYGYICTCKPDDWRDLKERGVPCPHRGALITDQTHLWDKMFDGSFGPREASFIIKTDLKHPNPALRDFVALRIEDTPHPRTGTEYRIYPLMNFSVAIDDHLSGLTHVLRGKDHLNNTYRQMYIFKYMNWIKPVYIHYGRVRISGPELKTSVMSAGIAGGEYSGWDDPRLGTLKALSRRGIRAEALRQYWVRAGISEVDVEFSWETLFSLDKELIDPVAKRYFFVADPVLLTIKEVDCLDGRAPLHPSDEGAGYRFYSLEKPIRLYVSRDDLEYATLIRLKHLCNVEISNGGAIYRGNDLSAIKEGYKIIHWVPEDSYPMTVIMPDGSEASGYGERGLQHEVGNVVQLERFGFARIENYDPKIIAVFAHR